MKRTSRMAYPGVVLLAIAVAGLVLPLNALAASAQLRPTDSKSTVLLEQDFPNGSHLILTRASALDTTVGEAVVTGSKLRGLDRETPRRLPQPMNFAFLSSEGERFDVRLELLDPDGRRAQLTLPNLFSIELRFQTLPSGQRVLANQQLRYRDQVIPLTGSTATSSEDQILLEQALMELENRLSPQMKMEIQQVAASLNSTGTETDFMGIVGPGEVASITAPLRSRGALDCSMATVGYLGSILTLSACLAILGCVVAVALHYAAIYGAVTACVDWIREDFGDRVDGTGGDGGSDDGSGDSGS